MLRAVNILSFLLLFKKTFILFNETDYIHLSGNNSLEDTNYSVLSDESVVNFLKSKDLSKKTFTLEVYEEISKIINDYNFLKNLIENK